MSAREQRLRERIDALTDERDVARAAADKERKAKIKAQRALAETKRSRDSWRQRALDAQRVLLHEQAKQRMRKVA